MLESVRAVLLLLLIVVLLAFQVALTRYVPWLNMLDLPLVAVLYLTIAKESLLWTIFAGSAVGFLQDSLSVGVLGMNGFTKISIGFLAYMANSVFAIDRHITRWALLFLSSIFATLLFFLLRILFLNRDEMMDGKRLLVSGALNAFIGLFLFYVFDRISRSSSE
jgi:rod shape-determining protein MreD